MSGLDIRTAAVFEPLLNPSRYKGAYGGRGSGKSHFFAGALIEEAMAVKGTSAVCIREIQKDLRDSAKRLLEGKLADFRLGEPDGFKVFQSEIRTPGDGVIIFQGMQDHTAESVKSLEGFRVAWVEEAQTLSARSLSLLRPTIRAAGSEIWASWNPRRQTDPIDMLLRGEARPTDAIVVRANWDNNPWFPDVLKQERLDCLEKQPDQYDHIWEGGYARVTDGAYYAAALNKARLDGRIGHVAADPLLPVRLVFDIGGTGARADLCSIWAVQFVGRELRWINHYSAQGQPLSVHVDWIRRQGYASAQVMLPHDGASQDKVFDTSYEKALRQAGFDVLVVPNQGRGAANARIEAARRLFPAMWFDEARCAPGLEALGSYHAKKDEARGIDLGPEHDWASHDADAFGLGCIAFESLKQEPSRRWNFKPVKVV